MMTWNRLDRPQQRVEVRRPYGPSELAAEFHLHSHGDGDCLRPTPALALAAP